MFILGDDTHDRGKIPWVTFTLICVNIMTFSAQCRFGDRMTNGFALVPKEITEFRDITKKQPLKVHGAGDFHIDEDGDVHFHGRTKTIYISHYPGPVPIVLTLFTYQYLHGDIFHLLFNMWFLYIFGRNVECSLHHGKFFAFYTFAGVMAGVAQWGAESSSIIPVVGASGAIAGVMGAYLAIFPWNNMKIVWGGIGLMFGVVQVPAFVVIGIWFFGQFAIGAMTMHDDLGGGTAYWCHIGGFLTGFLTIKGLILYVQYELAKLKEEEGRELSDEPPRPGDPLPTPEVPTNAELDAILDPVEAFKRARAGVFRNAPENDPFDRPDEGPLVAELIKEEPEEGIVANLPTPRPQSDGGIANLPRPRASTPDGIVANLPRPRTRA